MIPDLAATKAEAVVKYREIIAEKCLYCNRAETSTVYSRVIDFDAANGNPDEARKLIGDVLKADSYSGPMLNSLALEQPEAKALYAEMTAKKKADTDAKDKVEAFKRVIAKLKSFPDKYATYAEKDKFKEEFDALRDKFQAIPFDGAQNKDEAKEMIKAFDEKVKGNYKGDSINQFEAQVEDIRQQYMNSK